MPIIDQCLGQDIYRCSINSATCDVHGYLCSIEEGLTRHGMAASRRRRYEVEYGGDSLNDAIRYRRYPNLGLLISQSTHKPSSHTWLT